MNVLQANNFYQIVGGSDAVFFNTIDLLLQAGHRVVPFAAAGDKDLESPFARHFPEAFVSRSARPTDIWRYVHNRDAARSLASLILESGPFDIAHLHIYYGRLTSAILPILKRCGIPIVQTLHEYKLACPVYTMSRNGKNCEACVNNTTMNVIRYRCKGNSLLKSSIVLTEYWASRLQGDVRSIDKLICVSDFQRSIMNRAGIPEDKLVTLHNFVDPGVFTPAGPSRESYLLYFGRIEKLKGVQTLIRSVQMTGTKLKIAGTGSWSAEMLREIEGISNIEALGQVSGKYLQDLVARARAVVVPSEWYENCPMSVLEAKAAGTPVIGARIGGIPELIRDGVDGLLFEAGNEEDLARAILDLDRIDLSSFGASARDDIVKRFSPAQHLVRLLEIYASVQ